MDEAELCLLSLGVPINRIEGGKPKIASLALLKKMVASAQQRAITGPEH